MNNEGGSKKSFFLLSMPCSGWYKVGAHVFITQEGFEKNSKVNYIIKKSERLIY